MEARSRVIEEEVMSRRVLVSWPSQEYYENIVRIGLLSYYDISAYTRETHDELIAKARLIKQLSLRLEEFQEIYNMRFEIE